jgi:hypothetical protein
MKKQELLIKLAAGYGESLAAIRAALAELNIDIAEISDRDIPQPLCVTHIMQQELSTKFIGTATRRSKGDRKGGRKTRWD